MVVVGAQPLEQLLTEVFAAVGCSAAESARIGSSLVGANLAGHDSHGVVRTQRYVEWLRSGVQVADQTLATITESDAFALLDGGYGMGQTIGPLAVQVGIDKARGAGVSVIALRHAGHLGRIGEWAELAASAGLVSIHVVNVAGGQLVAPFGGIDRRMATNPVCIGVPLGEGRPPLVLDFATSLVAEGKALVAFDGGAPLPAGSLIDGDGQLSSDPTVLYGDREEGRSPNPRRGTGALRAMGDHKGSGLAMMCEVLAGALTGSGTTGPKPNRFCNGMLSVYLDPGRFDLDGAVAGDILEYVDWFRSARPAVPGGEVLAPGDAELRKRADRLANGVPLPDDTWASILEAADAAGLGRERALAIAGLAAAPPTA
jgi:uncharacterized oxidoreductase